MNRYQLQQLTLSHVIISSLLLFGPLVRLTGAQRVYTQLDHGLYAICLHLRMFSLLAYTWCRCFIPTY